MSTIKAVMEVISSDSETDGWEKRIEIHDPSRGLDHVLLRERWEKSRLGYYTCNKDGETYDRVAEMVRGIMHFDEEEGHHLELSLERLVESFEDFDAMDFISAMRDVFDYGSLKWPDQIIAYAEAYNSGT